jgi:glutamate synthase (NADPH) large chain
MASYTNAPAAQGLYDPTREHDACGVAFVATLTGIPSHDIVDKALTALRNLEHRGASGSEPDSGDGAGILIQIPDAFFREVVDFSLPEAGSYAAGIAFLPVSDSDRARAKARIEAIAAEEGVEVLGWRSVPVDASTVGATARSVMPVFEQLFVATSPRLTGLELDRMVYGLRKRSEHDAGVYFGSLSSRTIVYKGMVTTLSSSRSIPTSPTRGSSPSSRSCTRATRRTRSRRGLSHSRSA